jgi:predicted RNA-binding Zn-ribbon protein involved in translation (DUF1610 family)
MARSGKRMHKPRCKRCRLQRLPEENFVRGLCPACLATSIEPANLVHDHRVAKPLQLDLADW